MSATLAAPPPDPESLETGHSTNAERNDEDGQDVSFAVRFRDGSSKLYGARQPAFEVRVESPAHFKRLLASDAYTVAMAFVRGEFSIRGDLVAGVRFYRTKVHSHGFRYAKVLLHLVLDRLQARIRTKDGAAQDVRFHYDQPAGFYEQFLDSRMVYSCAYFRNASDSLEEAQLTKMDHICRKLDLKEQESFLDVGCGWGGLVLHAVQRYGVSATGCTLSAEQEKFAANRVQEYGFKDRAFIVLRDYRDLRGHFDKIASVGMFEHVGRTQLARYFSKLSAVLQPDGLLLNHGLVRPATSPEGPETVFLRRQVFPGAEIVALAEVIEAAERAGFEIVDVENLRPHYALTCRAWVSRLQTNAAECLRFVDLKTYRAWLLALAASAASFEDGEMGVCQVLLRKRSSRRGMPLTREYVYLGTTSRDSCRS
jgi:cyclopropane-fatty-acyl-phospholipid synthase